MNKVDKKVQELMVNFQHLEEAHGTEDTAEYINILNQVKYEIEKRIDAAASHLSVEEFRKVCVEYSERNIVNGADFELMDKEELILLLDLYKDGESLETLLN